MRLGDLADRAETDLSRGQKQRVMIARCLLSDPTVLFLDEPTSGLDPTAAASLRDRLATLADEGRTLCYSTHNLYEAERMADELTVVRDGRVVAQGPEAALSEQLRSGVTAVRVRADATAGDFDALGFEASQDGEGWLVQLTADRTVPDLVRALVERGVDIAGVWPEETSLEELYRELAGGPGDD
jgi:ABC-type multidrug transport system ATPase subunit